MRGLECFFHYHCEVMNMGFKPFWNDTYEGGRFDLGRYRCRGRAYYLKRTAQAMRVLDKDTNVVFFYDPAPTDYPCVKTMIQTANHFTMIKAREILEINKVFDLCS